MRPNQAKRIVERAEFVAEQRIPLWRIKLIVAEAFGIPLARLLARTRRLEIVRPRQIAMWLCREYGRASSLPMIGREFGGKDPTTVMHACRVVDAMRQSSAEMERLLATLGMKVKCSSTMRDRLMPDDRAREPSAKYPSAEAMRFAKEHDTGHKLTWHELSVLLDAFVAEITRQGGMRPK